MGDLYVYVTPDGNDLVMHSYAIHLVIRYKWLALGRISGFKKFLKLACHMFRHEHTLLNDILVTCELACDDFNESNKSLCKKHLDAVAAVRKKEEVYDNEF